MEQRGLTSRGLTSLLAGIVDHSTNQLTHIDKLLGHESGESWNVQLK